MQNILYLIEEVETGGKGKGPDSIVSTSLTVDEYCCASLNYHLGPRMPRTELSLENVIFG